MYTIRTGLTRGVLLTFTTSCTRVNYYYSLCSSSSSRRFLATTLIKSENNARVSPGDICTFFGIKTMYLYRF